MNQTGSGALSRDDVEILRSGYIVIVPRPSGGILALFDESKLQRAADDSKLRVIFYFSSLYSEYAAFGKTIIHVVTSAKRPELDLDTQEWQIRKKAMPGSGLVQPKTIVAQAYEEGKQELIDYLAYRTLSIEEFKTQMRPQRIAGNSVRNTLTLLEELGLERSLLPRCLGGDFDYSQFDEWIRVRLSIEGGMSAAPLHHFNSLPVPEETGTPPPQEQQTSHHNNQISAQSTWNTQRTQIAAQLWQPQQSSQILAEFASEHLQGTQMTEQCWQPQPVPFANQTLPGQLDGSVLGQNLSLPALPHQLATGLPQIEPLPYAGPYFDAPTTAEAVGPRTSQADPNQPVQPAHVAAQTSQAGHQSKKPRTGTQNSDNTPGAKKYVRTYIRRNKKVEDLKEKSSSLQDMNCKLRENNRVLENYLAQA
eukprot:scaffold34676_cov176-Amphora_coffeaeformis.AAC.1